MTKRVTRLITYGTFDLFHHGHLLLLERLATHADELYVGCSTDGFNAIKNKEAIIPYDHRVAVLKACKYVTHVFPEENWAQKRTDIVKYKIDIFAMGDDWAGKFDDLGDLAQVLYLPRTPDVSTTRIVERILTMNDAVRRVAKAG
jgi:glycerol-3-phosphate cytidylyltransferase